ncbi:hypothetical protein JCM8547_007136 [Rhodosporidiobolus lusitaniae]
MVLTRSDSSTSAWLLPDDGDEGDEAIHDQRRIRHLSAVLVRNLTLDPERDELTHPLRPSSLRSLTLDSPTLPQRSKDASEEHKSNGTGFVNGGRKRSGSAASWKSAFEVPVGDEEEREIVLDAGQGRPPSSRTRARRSSSVGTLLTRPSTAKIEEEEAETSTDPADNDPSLPSTSSPRTAPSRPRSSSRLSNTSINSSSTIRHAPRLAPKLPSSQQNRSAAAERPPPPTSSQFAQREKQRREEAIRRRLLDSFVSLELVPPGKDVADGKEARAAGRERGASVVSVPPPSLSSRMRRSDSASSVLSSASGTLGSPRKAMRWRTASSSLISSNSSSSALASSSSSSSVGAAPQQPFFVSSPSLSSTHPTFPIDHDEFILPPSASSSGSTSCAPLDATEHVAAWPGLPENRLRVKVFVRLRKRRDGAEKNSKEKGKEKAEEEDEDREDWRCLIEWDVSLDGLISLGRDPTTFPSLPPNTLIFALSPCSSPFLPFSASSHLSSSSTASPSSASDVEYFTAPLPLLHRSLRRSRRAARAASFFLALSSLSPGRGALSEDEEEDLSSCSSDDSSGFLGGRGEDGNLSDPGVSSSSAAVVLPGVRPRSGTLTLRLRRERQSAKKRALAERLRAEEDRRKRAQVLEMSRRETRMVRPAEWGRTREVWEIEREVRKVWEECARVKGRLGGMLKEGMEEGERERDEVRDRVEDFETVKGGVVEEVGEMREELDRKKRALRERRARLEAARMLDEDNLEELEQKQGELDKKDRSLSDIASASLTRRTQLITLLSSIFPIEPVLPSASLPSPPPLLFSICALPLPNSSYTSPTYSDETLSSALGYAAQLTQTLAAYLGVPLCYPIRCSGSRSTVMDEISMMKGPRAFPLYGKGVDSYRFDYGVFLLNKNIEQNAQLMHSQNLTVLDLRNTLPNLKTLVLSLSYDPSHADYRASTLLPVPPFLAEPEPPPPAHLDVASSSSDERPRSPSPAGSSVDSNTSSSSSAAADWTPASSTSSLPPLPASTRPSRSPSLASTIRAASPTPTVRAEAGGVVEDGEVDGATRGRRSGKGSEKRQPSCSRSPPVAGSAADDNEEEGFSPMPTVKLKTHTGLVKERLGKPSAAARSWSSSGGAGGGGRGGGWLWNAVAGRGSARGGSSVVASNGAGE